MTEQVTTTTLRQQTPFAQYQVVDVTFVDAHTDLIIPHTLQPASPEHIDYTVLRQAGQAAVVYHDTSGDRVAWTAGAIRLRSNIAGTQVRLLLSVAHGDRVAVEGVNASGPNALVEAEDVTGELALANIPDLPASKTTSGLFANARIATGTPDGTKFLRDDQVWAAPSISAAWPVGSVFISVVATNPATLLGFGTWAAFAAGRVLVGIDTTQTEFDTVEEVGGAKTHMLTAAEMPAHTHAQDAHGHAVTDPGHNHTQNAHNHTQDAHGHGVTDPTHAHGIRAFSDAGFAAGADGLADNLNTGQPVNEITEAASTGLTVNNATATNQATTATNNAAATGLTVNNATATNQSTGGGGAHNNLQPYIVVHMWKRTA